MNAWSKEISAIGHALLPDLSVVIPEYTQLEPYRDRNLNSWREKGSYNFHVATQNSFELQVNLREYGAILFAEAQHLLNHAAEQRAHILSLLASTKERDPSPSWLFVTLYYMALYVAMSWTRVANVAVVYLDKDSIRRYCAMSNKFPRGGAFTVSTRIDPSSSIPYTKFKKCNSSHFHEAVWITAHGIADRLKIDIESKTSGRRPTSDEFLALRGLSLFQGYQFPQPMVWQSHIRNGINYRPGYSYRSVVKNNFLHTLALLSKPNFPTLNDVISFGERAKHKLLKQEDPFKSIDNCVDLLVSQTLFIETAVEASLIEFCKFRNLKYSAFSSRKNFRRKTCCANSILNTPG